MKLGLAALASFVLSVLGSLVALATAGWQVAVLVFVGFVVLGILLLVLAARKGAKATGEVADKLLDGLLGNDSSKRSKTVRGETGDDASGSMEQQRNQN